jgi:hypothetical protein
MDDQAIAVVLDMSGPTFLPKADNDVVALIMGVQLLQGDRARQAFEASKMGYLLTVEEFVSQPIAVVRGYLAKGLSVEARSLLLGQSKLKPTVRAALEAIAV